MILLSLVRGVRAALLPNRGQFPVFKDLAGQHPQGVIVLATHGNLLALLMNHYDPSVGFDHWNALSSPDIYRVELDVSTEVQFERMWSPAEC